MKRRSFLQFLGLAPAAAAAPKLAEAVQKLEEKTLHQEQFYGKADHAAPQVEEISCGSDYVPVSTCVTGPHVLQGYIYRK